MRGLALIAVLAAACGGDDGNDDRLDENGCTIAPMVDDPGDTPRLATIDPQPIDNSTTVALNVGSVMQDDASFPLGVQSGSIESSSALLLTKFPAATEITVKVWRDGDSAAEIRQVIDEVLTPGDAGLVRYAATGLAPSTEYRYAFFTSDGQNLTGRSTIGRFVTAYPEGEMLRLRVGATTCTGPSSNADLTPFPALSLLAGMDIDLTVHLGDISYNDGASGLGGYRQSWANTLSQDGYRDLLATAGMYATWDDHEVDDNYDPETINSTRFDNAMQTYFEHIASTNQGNNRLWTSYQWGDTVEFIITDLRTERKPSTLLSDNPQFVSNEQLEFIKERLQNSTAHFKVVFSSVNITNMPAPLWDVELALNDRWEGYRTQRQDLLQFIVDQDIENVWFLAGDIHVGFIGRVEPEGPFSNMWEITVGPGASGDNPLGLLYENDVNPEDVFPCNQFIYGRGRTQVATTIDFDAANNLVAVEYVDVLTNEVLFSGALQQEPRN